MVHHTFLVGRCTFILLLNESKQIHELEMNMDLFIIRTYTLFGNGLFILACDTAKHR